MTKQKWLDDFAYNLFEMMDYTNTSQAELSRLTGLTRQNIIRFLKAEAVPSMIAVINIAKALDCEIDELVKLDEIVEL
jgi:transcriptional regulator with XRE-family HTH domain